LLDPFSGKLQGHLIMSGFMESHTQWMSDQVNNAEVNGAAATTGNGEEWHHDFDNVKEVGAHDDEDHYDGEQNVEDANTEEVPLTSVVWDPHLQELLLKSSYDPPLDGNQSLSNWR
jgi:hypothetical protein